MLSRFLHRTPTPEPTQAQKIAKLSSTIRAQVEPKQLLGFSEASFLIDILRRIEENDNGKEQTDMLLHHLATSNGNTSYIEPFVEAAYKYNHPDKDFLGKLYSNYAASRIDAENGKNATFLVYKLLDDRFHNIREFPVNSFALLGQVGVAVPENRQETLLRRAMASNTPVEHIKSALAQLKIDPNQIKDDQQRTMLHTLMSENNYNGYRGSTELEHILDRTQKLGVVPAPDVFGRYPEEFGTPESRLVYAQYFESQSQERLSALTAYLQETMHNFGGLASIGSRNQEIYLTNPNPLNTTPKSTMFEHIFNSNDMAVISEFQRLIQPTTRQHMEIERSFPYVFIENYVCGPNAKPEVANQVFALLQDQTPKDLSTALGYFLMKSDNYYKNYNVDAAKITEYPIAIERIMDYQALEGLTDLMALEAAKLDTLAPATPQTTFSM